MRNVSAARKHTKWLSHGAHNVHVISSLKKSLQLSMKNGHCHKNHPFPADRKINMIIKKCFSCETVLKMPRDLILLDDYCETAEQTTKYKLPPHGDETYFASYPRLSRRCWDLKSRRTLSECGSTVPWQSVHRNAFTGPTKLDSEHLKLE